MVDYTTLSDEELYKAAGIKGNVDYSKLSDEELYKAAGVTPPPIKNNQQQTEELPWYTKTAKALAFGAAETRTKDANTLRKSGALGFNPDQIDKNTEWLKQQAGLQNYDPASAHFADSSKPWTERIGYLPRTLVEGIPTMAQHIAASSLAGPVGMLGSTALSEGGTSVDRVREADKTDPNVELTPQQKLRVGGNVGLQTILNEVGGRATLGATAPVKTVGMEGVKQAAGNVVKAAGIDAAVGGYGAGADKAIIEGQVPSVADVALPMLAGAAVGTAFRAPGAAREAAVATRFRELGKIDPQSRGDVANLLQENKGNFDATQKHLDIELSFATKGLDDLTKQNIKLAQNKVNSGQRLSPEEIQAVSSVDPEAGKVLQNMDTFSVMKGLDNGGLTGSKLVQTLKPFGQGTKLLDFGSLGVLGFGGHIPYLGHVSPEIAATILGTQAGVYGGARAIDSLTGASNPAKVITDKFAGSVPQSPTVTQARAAVFAKDLAERQSKAADAQAELDKATTEKDALDKVEADKKAADKKAKDDARAHAAAMKIARESLNARRNSDAMQERYNQEQIGNFQDKALSMLGSLDKFEAQKQKTEDQALRRQVDLMRNSQAVEDRRLVAESNSLRDILKEQRRNLGVREASESASASNASLALKVAKLRAAGLEEGEPIGPDNPYDPSVNSSSLSARPADVKANMALAKIRKKSKEAADKQAAKEQKAASEQTLAKAEVKVAEARKEARKATQEADPNYYVYSRHGVTERFHKDSIHTNQQRHQQSWEERQDARKFFLDDARDFLNTKQDKKTLDGLLNRWSKLRNKPKFARNTWDEFVDNATLSPETKQALKEGFDDIMWTWETTSDNE